MRFLGPDADAADEIASFDQIPDTSLFMTQYGRVLTAQATTGTASLTTASGLSINSLPTGTYLLEAEIEITAASGATNCFFQISYSGTATNNQLWISRFAGSAVVSTAAFTLNSENGSGTTIPQRNRVTGMFVATTSGNLTVGARRTTTAGTVEIGSFVKLLKVA